MKSYIKALLVELSEGPLTWHHAVRLGWSSAERDIGKAGVRRRAIIRAMEVGWIADCGGKLVITQEGRRDLRDAYGVR